MSGPLGKIDGGARATCNMLVTEMETEIILDLGMEFPNVSHLKTQNNGVKCAGWRLILT